MAALEQWIDTWESFEVEVLGLIDAGDDHVVSVIRERGKVKDSDAWVEHTRGAVWTVENQRIAKYEEHQDRAQVPRSRGTAGIAASYESALRPIPVP